MAADEICFETARALLSLIHGGELSAREVLTAHLEQIERLNPRVNAICTLVAERALEQAASADAAQARGDELGPLHGLPIAIKDLVDTKGIRTTFGSPIYRDHVPQQDAIIVERFKEAGAIIIGKTNTPEFGAGSNTFNPVFGKTLNPYDLGRTCGGSSGGAAVALACGMLPIADGSDLGGSVRNPPNFNNIVGLRPSPGRIPDFPRKQPWSTLPVLGPMARNVEDVALLLSVMAGPDRRDPISISEPGERFRAPLERTFEGHRVAWSPDLGVFRCERQVLDVLEGTLEHFRALGCHIEEAHPDFRDCAEIFQVLRAQAFAADWGEDYERHPELMKETVRWNIERGLELKGEDVSRAQRRRGQLFQRVREFFERYDFLLMPVSQVAPFDVDTEWIREIDGIEMETYVDWMMSCFLITLTESPAISVPAGFTPGGLPVGMQIVGPWRRELEVLQLARAFEEATRVGERRPPITALE